MTEPAPGPCGPLFDARVGGGRVVAGHGDLLADDIFCLDDGPRILDCLDFDDRLRWLDGLDDAAFLAMDLERLGAPALAEEFTSAYAEYSGDPAPPSLHHHYVAYRAFVRAKVACLRAGQGDPAAGFEARHLAEVTLRHLRAAAVTLVLVGGLPGTGKSALAGAVAGRLGFTVLNSDRIRKELAGLPAGSNARAPYGSGIYAAEWTERTYAELLRRASTLLDRGESVIADASFLSAQHRAAAAATAANASADLVQLRCTASRELAARRMKPGPMASRMPTRRSPRPWRTPWRRGPARWWSIPKAAARPGHSAGLPCSKLSRQSARMAPSMSGAPPGRTCSPDDPAAP